jgi:flagellar M-ring protein FliF
MNQWIGLWKKLSVRQRTSLGLAAILVVGSLSGFVWWKREQDFKPVFTGMSSEDAGAIVAKLKEDGTEYRLENNGSTVLVPTAKVAETRLQLATAGLPKTGRIGFELFDKANLGATDFAEQINYRRALEGELERTIKSIAAVEQARVHLTFPKDSVFLESRLPAKASVLLRLSPRAQITAENVIAVKNMVASAVEGLSPDAVSIMDVQGNLLSRGKKAQVPGEASDEFVEYRQRLERDLLEKINSTLHPLLGEGRFRAGVSVDCDLTSGEQSEETFDPEKSVMTSSTKTEETNSTGGQNAGVPGTSSNLPRATGRSASAGGGTSRRSETIGYQTSKTVRHLRLPQGTLKRISASILLDQNVRWEGQGVKAQRVLMPPAPESVRAIRELVAAAIGFTPARGDQLVIESLPFGSTLSEPPPPENKVEPQKPVTSPFSLTALGERRMEAAGLLVFLALGAFLFLRKRRKKIAKRVEIAKTIAKGSETNRVDSEKDPSDRPIKLLTNDSPEGQIEAARIETLVASLREDISEDAALAASVLRTWLDESRS